MAHQASKACAVNQDLSDYRARKARKETSARLAHRVQTGSAVHLDPLAQLDHLEKRDNKG